MSKGGDGRGDPAGLQELSTTSSSHANGSSDVSSSLSTLEGEKLRRIADQIRGLKDAMAKTPAVIPPEQNKQKRSLESASSPLELEIVAKPTAPSEFMGPNVDYEKVARVKEFLERSKIAGTMQPKTTLPLAEIHQPGHSSQTPGESDNPNVLPTYVACFVPSKKCDH